MSPTPSIRLDRAPPPAAVRIGLKLRRVLRRAGDWLLPPEFLAWEKVTAMISTRTIGALVETGTIDSLERRPARPDQLAAELSLDAGTLERVLRMGAEEGLVHRDRRGAYSLTAVGAALAGGHSPSIAPWALHMNTESVQRAWAGLADSVRTGEPSFPAVHGKSVWEHMAEHPDEERLFANAMRELTGLVEAWAVKGYPWPQDGTICDVAGGSGPLLAAILAANPGLRGIVVEAPGVLPEADSHLRAAGVRDRVELIEGNIFDRVDAKADVYTLKDILHDWDDERSLQILRTIKAAMAPGSRLVLVETLLEPDDPDPTAVRIDLHMLTQCDGGRQRSLAQLQSLLTATGFRPGDVHRTGGPALIEGIA